MMTSPRAKSNPALRPAVCPKFFRNRTPVTRASSSHISERILKVLSRLPSSMNTISYVPATPVIAFTIREYSGRTLSCSLYSGTTMEYRMSAAAFTIPQIPVTGQRDAGALQQIANSRTCQQLQLALALKMKAGGRPEQILIDVTRMTHHLTDPAFQTAENLCESWGIQKTSLSNPVKASGSIQYSMPVCHLRQHPCSRQSFAENKLLQNLRP